MSLMRLIGMACVGLMALAVMGFGAVVLWPTPDPEANGARVMALPTGVGGLSGLVMDPDGGGLLALSDQSYLVAADLSRDAEGRAIAFEETWRGTTLPPPRADWPDTWFYTDAEGLARMPDGRLAVSYEGLQRVMVHESDGEFSQWIVVPELFEPLVGNTGLESVAVRSDSTVFTLPERWEPADDTHRPLFVYRFDDETWRVPDVLPVDGGYVPVGLDLDDTGRLYVLERRVGWPLRFSSRIRRLTLGPDNTILEIETLLVTPLGQHGNLEGISLWHRSDGTRMVALVSDNNLHWFLPNDLVEYALVD
jgi:hypothetical protein